MLSEEQKYNLILRYLDEPENLAVQTEVEQFRLLSTDNERLFQELSKVWEISGKASILAGKDSEYIKCKLDEIYLLSEQSSPITRRYSFSSFKWVAAAMVLLISSLFLFYYKNNIYKPHTYLSDVKPGGDKALLTLADGKKIVLTNIDVGAVTKQDGLTISKTKDGQLVYHIDANTKGYKNKNREFNTIETPKGGVWQVILPDGTNVWLNAMSSLKYPLIFEQNKKRVVELRGEAYFEVAKNETAPFIVQTKKQEVEVLGTHFNVNSYVDEANVKTTLLEGRVKVRSLQNPNSEVLLYPGEQSSLTSDKININKVDAEKYIDWKEGYFFFNNEKQESILKKIARWYNVEIVYMDEAAKNVTYYGSLSRFNNVSKILQKFEQTGEVHFEINNNKISVYTGKKN